MKFFKQEYLDYDYKDEIKRAEMNKLWKEACKSYSDYFRTIENSFSKMFIDLYYKHDGFHDAPIRLSLIHIYIYNHEMTGDVIVNKEDYE